MAELYNVVFGNTFSNIFGSAFNSEIFAPVGTGPGLVFIGGSSNGQGIGVAANMTDFPAVTSAFSNVKMSRRGALAGANPTFVDEGVATPIDTQPRTVSVGGSYGTGTGGAELQLARALDAVNTTLWGIASCTADGSFLDASNNGWLNPGWPTTPPSGMERLFATIDAAIVAHNKPLRVFIWDHGNDGNIAAGANYFNNLITLFTRIRQRYGDIGIVIPILTNKNVSGGLMPTVRSHMECFAMRPTSARVRTVYLDDLGMRDAAHYADDAGGVLGYCTAGNRYSAAVISAANQTVDNSFPKWGCQADTVTATSLALPPIPLPVHFGTYNSKSDIGVLWYSGASANSITAPTGWTQVVNSPVFPGAVADARLHVFTKTLVPGEVTPSIADVASDEAKLAGICVIRNSTGIDVNPTFGSATAAAPNATVTWPTLTTVSNNCLILNIVAYRIDDVVSKLSGYTNATTLPSERVDIDSNVGSGYGIGIAIGTKATAGAIGATTATLSAACAWSAITIPFKP